MYLSICAQTHSHTYRIIPKHLPIVMKVLSCNIATGNYPMRGCDSKTNNLQVVAKMSQPGQVLVKMALNQDSMNKHSLNGKCRNALLSFLSCFSIFCQATCTTTGPGRVSCQCIRGWTGDGKACIAIDNCVTETRGGCHINADCNYIGPGQVQYCHSMLSC